MREFKKILKGNNILEIEGKSKTRSNGTNFHVDYVKVISGFL